TQMIASVEMATGAVPGLAATAATPNTSGSTVVEIQPLSRSKVILPEYGHKRNLPSMPKPAAKALEYHIQCTRNTAYGRPEWKNVRFEPLPPQFTLRPVLEKLEDLVKPKAAPAGIFPINVRAPRSRPVVMENILKVAAAVLIVSTIWLGT